MGELLGEFLTEMVELGKLLMEADECVESANEAMEGKTPFMGSDKVKAQFAKLNDYGKDLSDLASKGVTPPPDKKVSMDEVANPKTRAQASQKFKDNLKARDAFVASGEKLIDSLKDVEKSALDRSKAARDVSVTFKKLVQAPLPDLGVGQTTYFTFYQLFEQAAGTLGNIATYAKKAQGRIAGDLKKVEDDTDNMRDTLKTFGIK